MIITSHNEMFIFHNIDAATHEMKRHILRMRTSTKARHVWLEAKQRKLTRSASGETQAFLGGKKRRRRRQKPTETQGLELVLGVGERCTVTSAIQRAGNRHLRGESDRGETGILLVRGESGWYGAVVLSPEYTLSLTTPRLAPPHARTAHAHRHHSCQFRLTPCVLLEGQRSNLNESRPTSFGYRLD